MRGKTPEAQEAALRAAVAAGTITAEDFTEAATVRAIWRRDGWDTPPYSLTNLSANIARNRERLAGLEGRKMTDNSPVPVRKITVLECTCTRCGYVWTAKGEAPVRCAGCGSPYWSKPKRR